MQKSNNLICLDYVIFTRKNVPVGTIQNESRLKLY